MKNIIEKTDNILLYDKLDFWFSEFPNTELENEFRYLHNNFKTHSHFVFSKDIITPLWKRVGDLEQQYFFAQIFFTPEFNDAYLEPLKEIIVLRRVMVELTENKSLNEKKEFWFNAYPNVKIEKELNNLNNHFRTETHFLYNNAAISSVWNQISEQGQSELFAKIFFNSETYNKLFN